MAQAATFIGSSGTLIGSALESAGYFYQSLVIDQLWDGLGNVAVLIYICAAIAALISYIMTGRTGPVLWFFAGPSLYYLMITERVSTTGSDWIFGGEPRDRAKLEVKMKEVMAEKNRPVYDAKVSWVFAQYNELVSSTVRSIVSTINQNRKQSDLKLFVRAQLYGYTLTPELKDPAIRQLVQLSLMGQCRELVRSGKELADKLNETGNRCEHAKKYRDIASQRHPLDASSIRYLAGLKVDCPALFGMPVTRNVGDELRAMEAEINSLGMYPACDLALAPSTGGSAPFRPEVFVQQAEACYQKFAGAKPRNSADVANIASGSPDREQHLEAEAKTLAGQSFTCHEIWNFAFGALHLQALRIKQSVAGMAVEHGLDAANMVDELRQITGKGPVSDDILTRAIALRLFKTEAAQSPTAALVGEYQHRGKEIGNIGITGDEFLMKQEQALTGRRKWMSRTSLMLTAYGMPYYQGLILEYLGIFFPFFALLLLIPGKQAGFTAWFYMWLWAKSWDIGFAIVCVADDVLYSLFVHDVDGGKLAGQVDLNSHFSLALLSMREADPTFDVGTYYNIMSLSLVAIPTITSQLITATAVGAASMIGSGVRRMSEESFGFAGKLAEGSANAQNQLLLSRSRQAGYEHQMRLARQGVSGDTGAAPELNRPSSSEMPHSSITGTGSPRSASQLQESAISSALFEGISSGITNGGGAVVIGKGKLTSGNLGVVSLATNRLLGAAAGAAGEIQGASESATMDNAKRRLGMLAEAARWNAGDTMRDLSVDAMRRGMLQLTWQPGDEVLVSTFHEMLGRYDQDLTMLRGYIGAIDTAVNEGTSKPTVTELSPTRFMKGAALTGLAAGAAGALLGMTEEQANELQDSVGKKVGGFLEDIGLIERDKKPNPPGTRPLSESTAPKK